MVQGLLVRYANQHVQRAGLFHFRENIQERWEEVKVQLRVGFDWKRVGENYTQLQLYITKGERAPLDGRGGNVEKRERSGLVMCAACMHVSVCVCVCVCVSHLSSVLTLKLWLCREQEPRAGGGKMETLPPEGWAHTLGGDWLLAYFCLNENLWSKTVWKKYSVTCTVSELPLSACMCHCAFAFTYIKTESKVFFFFLRVPFNFQVLSAWLRKNQLLLLNYIQVFISLSVVLTSWYLTVCMKEKVFLCVTLKVTVKAASVSWWSSKRINPTTDTSAFFPKLRKKQRPCSYTSHDATLVRPCTKVSSQQSIVQSGYSQRPAPQDTNTCSNLVVVWLIL